MNGEARPRRGWKRPSRAVGDEEARQQARRTARAQRDRTIRSCHEQGWTPAELARVHGMSEGDVRVILATPDSDGRRRLPTADGAGGSGDR